MNLLSYRSLNSFNVFLCLLLLIAAGFLQFHLGLEPCPLCVTQRFLVLLLAILFLGGSLYTPQALGRKIYNGLILILNILGLMVSGRQIWLQHLPPDQVPACGPGFNFIIKNLPLTDAAKAIFYGSGECAKVDWVFLYMSIPEWTFLFFAFFSLVALFQFLRKST